MLQSMSSQALHHSKASGFHVVPEAVPAMTLR